MEQKNRTLIEVQKMDQNVPVEAFCASGYTAGNGSVSCSSGYSCGWLGVSSTFEEDDVIL
jgi:hypothetical protein